MQASSSRSSPTEKHPYASFRSRSRKIDRAVNTPAVQLTASIVSLVTERQVPNIPNTIRNRRRSSCRSDAQQPFVQRQCRTPKRSGRLLRYTSYSSRIRWWKCPLGCRTVAMRFRRAGGLKVTQGPVHQQDRSNSVAMASARDSKVEKSVKVPQVPLNARHAPAAQPCRRPWSSHRSSSTEEIQLAVVTGRQVQPLRQHSRCCSFLKSQCSDLVIDVPVAIKRQTSVRMKVSRTGRDPRDAVHRQLSASSMNQLRARKIKEVRRR